MSEERHGVPAGVAEIEPWDPDAAREVFHAATAHATSSSQTALALGGKGRAAIAIGDPDTANNTPVIVPGTGSSVRSG